MVSIASNRYLYTNREEVMRKRSPPGCRFQSEKKGTYIQYQRIRAFEL